MAKALQAHLNTHADNDHAQLRHDRVEAYDPYGSKITAQKFAEARANFDEHYMEPARASQMLILRPDLRRPGEGAVYVDIAINLAEPRITVRVGCKNKVVADGLAMHAENALTRIESEFPASDTIFAPEQSLQPDVTAVEKELSRLKRLWQDPTHRYGAMTIFGVVLATIGIIVALVL